MCSESLYRSKWRELPLMHMFGHIINNISIMWYSDHVRGTVGKLYLSSQSTLAQTEICLQCLQRKNQACPKLYNRGWQSIVYEIKSLTL